MGKKSTPSKIELNQYQFKSINKEDLIGAEKLDHSKVFSVLFGLLVLTVFLIQYLPSIQTLNLTPNMLNFFMLGLAILLHGSFSSFLHAVKEAIADVAGILIQFPLYFGIMGIMGSSGMINHCLLYTSPSPRDS